jgi:FCD domain-containing protein
LRVNKRRFPAEHFRSGLPQPAALVGSGQTRHSARLRPHQALTNLSNCRLWIHGSKDIVRHLKAARRGHSSRPAGAGGGPTPGNACLSFRRQPPAHPLGDPIASYGGLGGASARCRVQVTGPSSEELRELVAIRLILEREALRMALPRSTEQNLLEATHLQERIEIEDDPRQLEVLDNAFHNALYKSCENARLLRLISELRSEDRRPYSEQKTGSAKRTLWSKQHRRLLRRYAAGDCDGALLALEQHLSALMER